MAKLLVPETTSSEQKPQALTRHCNGRGQAEQRSFTSGNHEKQRKRSMLKDVAIVQELGARVAEIAAFLGASEKWVLVPGRLSR